MDTEIRLTRDGSHTLYNLALDESYHSLHGAIKESQHIFIEAGLKQALLRNSRIDILEVGMGSALNVLLTMIETLQKGYTIHYTAIEPFPISIALAEKLNYVELLGNSPQIRYLYRAIHQVDWEQFNEIGEKFFLKKVKQTLDQFDADGKKYDLVYFDAFAPSAQPELWAKEALRKISSLLNSGGILVTYSSKGQLRRDLKEFGLEVKKVPGPWGKRDITRAIKS